MGAPNMAHFNMNGQEIEVKVLQLPDGKLVGVKWES